MPDEVQIGELGDLLERFLRVALAEVALACRMGGAYGIRPERLGHRDENYVTCVPTRRPGTLFDPGIYAL